MNTHPIEQEELMTYLDGELPADRAGAAAGHLASRSRPICKASRGG
jgi:anti-sigma factor RsiW